MYTEYIVRKVIEIIENSRQFELLKFELISSIPVPFIFKLTEENFFKY